MDNLILKCPIRGIFKTKAKSKDGLKPSEEYYRVEAIKYFLRLGYPKENFKIEAIVKKFGNAGRNSLRADFAILDIPASHIKNNDSDDILNHAILLCEVKRENKKNEYVKSTQIKPLLDFSVLDRCVAIYWDNVDQRIYWNERYNGKRQIKEGPLAILPKYGQKIQIKPLCFSDLQPTQNFIDLFDRIEDILHISAIDLEQRFSVILQILLAKLFDEHGHISNPSIQLEIQDFESLGYDGLLAIESFNAVLKKAVNFYQKHLPKPVDAKLPNKINENILLEISKLVSPVLLIASI